MRANFFVTELIAGLLDAKWKRRKYGRFGWGKLVRVGDLSLQKDPDREKIFLSEVVLGMPNWL